MSFAFNLPSHFSNHGRCENRDLSWDEFNDAIKDPVEVESVEDKADAGFISLARYETTRRQAKFVQEVTAIGLDVDERCPDLPVLERRMKALGWSATIYETVSSTAEQRKVRVLAEIVSPIVRGDESVKEYGKRVGAIQKAVATQLGVVPDVKCVGDVGRIFYRPCYVGDQKIYFKRFKGDALDPTPFERLGLLGKIDKQATAEKAGLLIPERENSNGNYELPECPFADCHSNKKERGGSFVGEHYAIHCDHTTCGHNEDQSGYNTRAFLNRLVLTGAIEFDDIVEERQPTVEELAASGEPFGLLAQVERLLVEAGYRIRYNEFSDFFELWDANDEYILLSDSKEMVLRELWPSLYDEDPAPGVDQMHRALTALAKEYRSYHPVRDYLDGLPEWDGVERLDNWLRDYCGAADKASIRAMASKTLIAAVGRAYEPGMKFDQMLILQGPQGTKKSSSVAALCPNPDWFSDSIELGANPRQAIEQMAGVWIAEVPELVGNSKREIDQIKHMVSRQKERARMSYARNITQHERTSVLIGTTNDDEILRDPTGARRFWIVQVGECNPAQITLVRDQLFAEAKTRLANEKLWIDESDGLAHMELLATQRDFADNGPLYELISKEFPDLAAGWIRTTDVWVLVGVADIKSANNTTKNNIRRAMLALGFAKKVINPGNGKRVNAWVRNPEKLERGELVEYAAKTIGDAESGSKPVVRIIAMGKEPKPLNRN